MLVRLCAGVVAVVVALVTASDARADPIDDYTVANSGRVCAALDANPTVDGLERVGIEIMNEGVLSPEDVGVVVSRSIIGWCPRHMPVMEAFIEKWEPAVPV